MSFVLSASPLYMILKHVVRSDQLRVLGTTVTTHVPFGFSSAPAIHIF
jgi:hypothetical protein